VPLTFANKADVTLNLKGGDDFLLIDAATKAAGVNSLSVFGGSGSDAVAIRNVASSLTTSFPQFERILTTPDQIFVEELYQLRLGRFADEGGLNNWLGVLSGRGRRAVLNGIVGSDEALRSVVDEVFEELLGRHVDPVGLQGFVTFLRNGGTLEDLISAVGLSDEFQSQAGQTNDGTQREQLFRTLYQALLQRDATDQEVADAVAAANASNVGAVVRGIVQSREFRGLAVGELYREFFRRDADAPGLAGWVNSALDLLAIRSGLMESDEFFNRS